MDQAVARQNVHNMMLAYSGLLTEDGEILPGSGSSEDKRREDGKDPGEICIHIRDNYTKLYKKIVTEPHLQELKDMMNEVIREDEKFGGVESVVFEGEEEARF